jgi:carboxypeptidase Taq
MHAPLSELKTRLAEINDLRAAAALLHWDQTTYMPAGGAEARGRQMATLSRLAHEKFVEPVIGELLGGLEREAKNWDPDSDNAALLRVTRREYDRATKVPSALVGKISSHQADLYEAWARARPANDFKAVSDGLQKTVDLSRELANCFPGYKHVADPLIDEADTGMTAGVIRPLFASLREGLVPLVEAITAQPVADDACLRQSFPESDQMAFGVEVIKRFGYDFNRGRQDKTHHPFMTKFSLGDVRITTRFKENDLGEGLFSTLHEAGHALYEQGIDPSYEATPLGSGTSSGVHESQSRLWENLVGRSRVFWEYFYPRLQQVFPSQLGAVSLDTFYRAINKVERSLIRTDADEVTYNLHVMIRFELECQLLEGKLAVRDLPEAWRERYRSDLGVASQDDKDGVLQDVHWYGGLVGGQFQCYTLGNILAAQIFDAAARARPGVEAEIAGGEFGGLHGWLRENVYRHGSKYLPEDLVKRVTGTAISIEPYLGYLRRKFGDLYQLT